MFRFQTIIFALVSASFINIYITQPILPVLQNVFGADIVVVSFTVSAVILGMAIANLPFGVLVDRWPIHPIIGAGGVMVALGGFVCAVTQDLWILISARFFQGLFIPALTTCLAAFLAKTLPAQHLNVVMGSYVSATVFGGLCGRMLGGWLHAAVHWRYAFVTASVLILLATVSALWGLPRTPADHPPQPHADNFATLVMKPELLRLYLCAAGSFAIFSSIFNYLPFRLATAPFDLSTGQITLFYAVYVIGVFIGPATGKISNRFGSGVALIGGSIILCASLLVLLLPFLAAVLLGLLGTCAGFFTIHSAAVGSLNRKLTTGQGRANALYVLFYYIGGWMGITGAGIVYKQSGWIALVYFCVALFFIPLTIGISERSNDFR